MDTIVKVFKGLFFVIGITVLLFNPSFIAAATKGAPGHQPMIAARKAPAPVPPSDPQTPGKPVNRPRPIIKSPVKAGGTSAQKLRRTPKQTVPKPKPGPRNIGKQPNPKPQPGPWNIGKQPNPKPQPGPRNIGKQPNPKPQPGPRNIGKQPNPKPQPGPRNIGKQTGTPPVHDPRTSLNQGGTTGYSQPQTMKSQDITNSTRLRGDTPKPVEQKIKIGLPSDLRQQLTQDAHSQKIKSMFGKPDIFVPSRKRSDGYTPAPPPPLFDQTTVEADKRDIDRSSDKGPAASTGPRFNPEVASQANPIHQQNWTSSENIKSQQEALVQTASISDKAKREWNAAFAEVPRDESDSRGKLMIDELKLQGTTLDVEGDQGIVYQDDTGGHLDRDRSTDTVQGWKDKLGLGQVGTRHRVDATELILAPHEEGLGVPRSPGNVAENSSESEQAQDNLIHQVGGKTLRDGTAEHRPAGNPSSSGSAGSTEPGDTSDTPDEEIGTAPLGREKAKYLLESLGKSIYVLGAVSPDPAGSYLKEVGKGIVENAGTWVGLAGQYGGGLRDDVKPLIPDTDEPNQPDKGDKRPREDDPEGPGRDGDGQAALAEWNSRRGWVTQHAGEMARVYGDVDPNAPQERAKKRRDHAINPGNGENDSEGGGNPLGLFGVRETLPDPTDPTL